MKPSTKAKRTKRTPARKRTNPRPAGTAPVPPVKATDGQEVAQTPAAPPPAPPQPPAPVAAVPPAPTPPVEPEATTTVPEAVLIGHVEGVAERKPVEDVLGLLGQDALERIAYLRSSAAISALAERVRATDGRCAPVILIDDGDGLTFFHGFDAIAAAQALGDNDCCVVRVPSDELDFLQSAVAQRWGKDTDKDRFMQSASPA